MLEAAKKYYGSEEAVELLEMEDRRFGFEGLEMLWDYEGNGVKLYMASLWWKSMALTVGKLSMLDKSEKYDYMKMIQAARVSDTSSNVPQLPNDPLVDLQRIQNTSRMKSQRRKQRHQGGTLLSQWWGRDPLRTHNLVREIELPVKKAKAKIVLNFPPESVRKSRRVGAKHAKSAESLTQKRSLADAEHDSEGRKPAKKTRTSEANHRSL
jgi:hypothetical protein